jgi:hypothetical protein
MAGGIGTALLICGPFGVQAKPATLTGREAFEISTDAYVFGYPLVMMDMNRRVMTNVREPDAIRAPMGQFARTRSFPLASNHEISVPNADTLYAVAWLDVSREPWVLSLPDMKGRYALFPLLDGWTTVFGVLGTRTTGTGPQTCAITGPNWKGKLPSGLKEYKSPTGMVRVIGRIYCTGTSEDYAAVHSLQDQCSAVPLSSYGKPYTPPPGQVNPAIDMKTPVREEVNGLSVSDFFNRLAILMKENPPVHADKEIIKRMAKIGIVPGEPFAIAKLSSTSVQAVETAPVAALNRLIAWSKASNKAHDWHLQNGWAWTPKTGVYGTDYAQRALVAAIALGACRPEDITTFISTVDTNGQPYSGSFKYVMHFAPGQAPSGIGTWSLTMYDGDCFFAENSLGRYALHARDSLVTNLDGSLDLYFQHYPPAVEREANWLPAPEGKFILVLRFYSPKEALLKGSWKIPPVKRME